jgi:hypothetical protein
MTDRDLELIISRAIEAREFYRHAVTNDEMKLANRRVLNVAKSLKKWMRQRTSLQAKAVPLMIEGRAEPFAERVEPVTSSYRPKRAPRKKRKQPPIANRIVTPAPLKPIKGPVIRLGMEAASNMQPAKTAQRSAIVEPKRKRTSVDRRRATVGAMPPPRCLV